MAIPKFAKVGISAEIIGLDSAAALDVFGDQRLKGSAFDVGNGTGAQYAVTLHHAEHNRLSLGSASREALDPGLATADVGFIQFDTSGHRFMVVGLCHELAKFMRHAPRRFVGHAKLALQFLRGHTILAGGKQIHGKEPLLQRGSRLLKGRSHAWVNVMAAMLARIAAALGNPMKLGIGTTAGTRGRVSKLHGHDLVQASPIIGVFGLELLEGVFHGSLTCLRGIAYHAAYLL